MLRKANDLGRWLRENFKRNCYWVGFGLTVAAPVLAIFGYPPEVALQGGALALAALAFFKAHELYPPKP